MPETKQSYDGNNFWQCTQDHRSVQGTLYTIKSPATGLRYSTGDSATVKASLVSKNNRRGGKIDS